MTTDVLDGLATIRKRRARVWLFIFGTPCAFLITGLLTDFVGWSPYVVDVVGGMGFLGVVVSHLVSVLSRCPRCGRSFYCRWFGPIPLTTWRCCAHCGLRMKAKSVLDAADRVLLEAWLRHEEPRGPLPETGLTCPRCDYLLTGLLSERCPECGRAFSTKRLLAESA